MEIKVEAYWNLHRQTFSVVCKKKVIAHTNNLWIRSPRFVVQPSGWERVRKTGVKNVHAFVRGWADLDSDYTPMILGYECFTAHYNPRTFEIPEWQMRSPDGIFPLEYGDWAHLTKRGDKPHVEVWCEPPEYEDDGQPDEYTEWQDYMGGDDHPETEYL